jgi:hypothetical protein
MVGVTSQPSVVSIILIPGSIFLVFMAVFLFILAHTEKETNIRVRIIIYTLIQFTLLPLLLIFLVINVILITFSYLFCKRLYYISFKNICRCRKSTDIGVTKKIIVKTKQAQEDNSGIELKEKDIKIDNMMKAGTSPNIQADNDSTKGGTYIYPSVIHVPDNGNKGEQSIIINVNKNFPQTGRANKSKIMEFLKNALVADNNTPGYINFIRNFKNKTREKLEA